MNPHNWMTALSPPHTENRKWQCIYCQKFGTYGELIAIECSYVYPPCVHCGQTPECAPDCKGINTVLRGLGWCECWQITETDPSQNGAAWLAAHGVFARNLFVRWVQGERFGHHPLCPLPHEEENVTTRNQRIEGRIFADLNLRAEEQQAITRIRRVLDDNDRKNSPLQLLFDLLGRYSEVVADFSRLKNGPARAEFRVFCLQAGCDNKARYGGKRFCGIHAGVNMKKDSDSDEQ